MSGGEHVIYGLTRRIEAREARETTGWGEQRSMEIVLENAVAWLKESDGLLEIDKASPFLTPDERKEIEDVRVLIKQAKELYDL